MLLQCFSYSSKKVWVFPRGIFSAVCSCIAVCLGFVLNRNSVSFIIPKFCEMLEETILWKVIVYRNLGSEWWMVYCHGINKQTQKQWFNWSVWEIPACPLLVSSSALHLAPCWKSLKKTLYFKISILLYLETMIKPSFKPVY